MTSPQACANPVALVQQNLPTWATTLPAVSWDSTYIQNMLNQNGNNVLAVVRLFWLQRVSDTSPFTDIHDANSSRPLSQSHEHAVKMLAYWDNYIETGHTRRSGKIKKRYKHRKGLVIGVDPFGFGSPYARTD